MKPSLFQHWFFTSLQEITEIVSYYKGFFFSFTMSILRTLI